MRFFTFLKAAPLTLALACGTVDSDKAAIESATTKSDLTTWQTLEMTIAAASPLANSYRQVFDINATDTTRQIRVRFSEINLEEGYDFLVIQDEWGNEVQRITGRHTNFVSQSVYGKKAKLVVETDYALQSQGFTVDVVEYQACNSVPASAQTLVPVANCNALETKIKAMATAEITRRFEDNGVFFGGPIRPQAANARAAGPAGGSAPSHSETNTQVAGVDEADIVKTDGNKIYAVSNGELRVFASWPAVDTQIEHRVAIQGWPREMFLHQGKAVVLSGVSGDGYFSGGGFGGRMMPMWWSPEAFTKVTVVGFGANGPVVERETLLAGQYQTARRVGDSMRVILRRQVKWPTIQYYPEGVEWGTPAFDAEMAQLKQDALTVVARTTLSDWLPKSYRIENGQRVELPTNCADFLTPNTDDNSLGLTTVATVDLGASANVQETSMMIDPGLVYQSASSLYMTNNHNWACYEDAGNQGQYTNIHKFDVSSPARSTYVASGAIVGGIDDQFNMDEQYGYLRVASSNQRWARTLPEEQSVSRVYVLGQSGTSLNVVGQTKDLAPGERIMGARFIGNRGFVVTFRQVDPLFTIDLTNPRQPQVLGELKIPGFSTYLHPLGANHVFTIGQDFEMDGTTRNGVALSIFDVTDLRQPRLAHKSLVSSKFGYSEGLNDHKAFTMYQVPGRSDYVVAIPFTDYATTQGANYWQSFTSSLKVFQVSPTGILGLGEIDHKDLFETNADNQFGYWYRPNVRRGVFVDQFVYAWSDAGIKVANVNNVAQTVATVRTAPVPRVIEPATGWDHEQVTATTNALIPDGDTTGLASSLQVTKEITAQYVSVNVKIDHSYRSDLQLVLEHDGVREVLFDRLGGSLHNLNRSFQANSFRGKLARGTWTLRVLDLAGSDVGTLVEWSLSTSGRVPGTGAAPVFGGGVAPVAVRGFGN